MTTESNKNGVWYCVICDQYAVWGPTTVTARCCGSWEVAHAGEDRATTHWPTPMVFDGYVDETETACADSTDGLGAPGTVCPPDDLSPGSENVLEALSGSEGVGDALGSPVEPPLCRGCWHAPTRHVASEHGGCLDCRCVRLTETSTMPMAGPAEPEVFDLAGARRRWQEQIENGMQMGARAPSVEALMTPEDRERYGVDERGRNTRREGLA